MLWFLVPDQRIVSKRHFYGLAFLQIEDLLYPLVLRIGTLVRVHLEVQLHFHAPVIGRIGLGLAGSGHGNGIVAGLLPCLIVLEGHEVIMNRGRGADISHGHLDCVGAFGGFLDAVRVFLAANHYGSHCE